MIELMFNRRGITEEVIIKELHKHFANHDYRLSNVFMYLWESDFFCISTSGYAIEVEVKISKSDFKADFKKTDKHCIVKNGNDIHNVKQFRPNRFYYCCPEGLIDKNEVPEYAGLLYYHEEVSEYNQELWGTIKEIKTSKFIHKEKFDLSKRLLSKYYYMAMDLKNDVRILRDRVIELERFFKQDHYLDGELNTRIFENKPYFEPTLFD
jgi:hypothetical protein